MDYTNRAAPRVQDKENIAQVRTRSPFCPLTVAQLRNTFTAQRCVRIHRNISPCRQSVVGLNFTEWRASVPCVPGLVRPTGGLPCGPCLYCRDHWQRWFARPSARARNGLKLAARESRRAAGDKDQTSRKRFRVDSHGARRDHRSPASRTGAHIPDTNSAAANHCRPKETVFGPCGCLIANGDLFTPGAAFGPRLWPRVSSIARLGQETSSISASPRSTSSPAATNRGTSARGSHGGSGVRFRRVKRFTGGRVVMNEAANFRE
jgi:hypothetical protein